MILVTGGTGLVGSHLLFELTKEPTPVKAIYRTKKRWEKVRQLFLYYDSTHGQSRFETIEWVECDVLDSLTLFETMQGCSVVYHCAAMVSFQKKDFYTLMKINRKGTENVVNCCLELGVSKLGYISSTAAIGSDETDKIVTEATKWKQSETTSGYSISKYSAEKEVWRGVEEGLDVIIINPCVVIGAGDWNESSLTIFKSVDKGLRFYTSGANAFVDARDVVASLVYLMKSTIKNERFLCIGENSTFKNVFDQIAIQLSKKKPSILVKPWLIGITWRLMWLISKVSGKPAVITRETARSAFGTTVYDASKLKNVVPFQFRSIEEMVENAVKGKVKVVFRS